MLRFNEFSEYKNTSSLSEMVTEINRRAREEAKDLIDRLGIEIEDIFREVQDIGISVLHRFISTTPFSQIEFSIDGRIDEIFSAVADAIERVEHAEGISPAKIELNFAMKTEIIHPMSDFYIIQNQPAYKDAKSNLEWCKEALAKYNAKRALIKIIW